MERGASALLYTVMKGLIFFFLLVLLIPFVTKPKFIYLTHSKANHGDFRYTARKGFIPEAA